MSDHSQQQTSTRGSSAASQSTGAAGTSSSTSSSSFMSQFYTPMNPTFAPQQQQPPAQLQPQTQTHASQAQEIAPAAGTMQSSIAIQYPPGPSTSVQSMGPGAALILANLTTLPGFLSEAAIQEARQEYLDQQQQHAQIFVSTSAQPSLSTQHQDSTSYDNTPTVDHNAKIGALLRELQQTSASTQISSSNYSTTVASLPPLTSPQSLSQSSQQAVQEDFSNGKITPQLLKALAALAETDTQQGGILQKEISKLKQQQLATERAMFEERQELLNRQKKDLVKLQAKEIMGMDIKTELQQKQAEHSSELKQFDRRVLRRLDREIKTTQESLANAKVPMMTGTSDPGKIAAQIRVLRLLEDMLQGE